MKRLRRTDFVQALFAAPLDRNTLIGPGLFRLFLALVVFVHHASRIALGTAAVEVFFCLSGFWIYKMWTGRYVYSLHPFFTYIISRCWRLIPTFVLIAFFTLIFQHVLLERSWTNMRGLVDWPHFIASHLLILGYNSLPVKPLGPAWSLDVEMQFYLVAPILIILAIRFGAMALLIAATVTSLLCALRFGVNVSLTFVIFFALGIAAGRQDWRPSPRLATVAGIIAIVLVTGLAFSPWRGALLGGAHPGPLFRYSELVNTTIALLAFPYAIFTTRQRGSFYEGTLADLSYIIYLLHWSAIGWLGTVAILPAFTRFACFVLAVAATFAGAWVIWKFFDKPLNGARARWVAARVDSCSL